MTFCAQKNNNNNNNLPSKHHIKSTFDFIPLSILFNMSSQQKSLLLDSPTKLAGVKRSLTNDAADDNTTNNSTNEVQTVNVYEQTNKKIRVAKKRKRALFFCAL